MQPTTAAGIPTPGSSTVAVSSLPSSGFYPLPSSVAPIVTRIGLRRVWRSSSSHHSISGTAVDGFETTANGYADDSANVSADAADAPGTAADGCADGCADCADSGTAADGFWIVRMVQLRMVRMVRIGP